MDNGWDEQQRIEDFMKRKPKAFNDELVDYMITGGFFVCPSSANHHGAFEGGNFWHSRMVSILIREYTDKIGLEWGRHESPEIIGWLHDLCKMDDYIKTEGSSGIYYERRQDTEITGHGTKSAIMALSRMHLTDEEIRCICWHMGAFTGKGEWGSYTAAVRKYPNILWVHQADMVASQIKGI